MSLLLILPSTYILSYTPIRVSIAIITVSTIVGAWLRCLVNTNFWFAVVGQYVFAISYAFLRSIVTRLSSIWFKPEWVRFALT